MRKANTDEEYQPSDDEGSENSERNAFMEWKHPSSMKITR
jgi:hypothetical protein